MAVKVYPVGVNRIVETEVIYRQNNKQNYWFETENGAMGKIVNKERNRQQVQNYAGIHQPGQGGHRQFDKIIHKGENLMIQTKKYTKTKGIISEFV
jgi:hypothetical protein